MNRNWFLFPFSQLVGLQSSVYGGILALAFHRSFLLDSVPVLTQAFDLSESSGL